MGGQSASNGARPRLRGRVRYGSARRPQFLALSPDTALPARRLRFRQRDEEPQRVVYGRGAGEDLRHVGIQEHDVGALLVALVVLAANGVAEIVLCKHLATVCSASSGVHIAVGPTRTSSADHTPISTGVTPRMPCRPTGGEGATRASRLSSRYDGVPSKRVAIPACLERNAAGVPHRDLRQNVAARCCSCPPVACCSIQRSPRDSVQSDASAARLSQCARVRVRRTRGSDHMRLGVARLLCNVVERRTALGRISDRAR